MLLTQGYQAFTTEIGNEWTERAVARKYESPPRKKTCMALVVQLSRRFTTTKPPQCTRPTYAATLARLCQLLLEHYSNKIRSSKHMGGVYMPV